jgi:hypothetical protein
VRADSDGMPTAHELLAARARRVRSIRRRIVATVLAAFVLAWGVVAFDGPMGTTTTVASTSTAKTTSPTTSSSDSSTSSSDTTSSHDGSAAAMTTSQS